MSEKNKTDEIRYVGIKENLAYGFANAGQVFGLMPSGIGQTYGVAAVRTLHSSCACARSA